MNWYYLHKGPFQEPISSTQLRHIAFCLLIPAVLTFNFNIRLAESADLETKVLPPPSRADLMAGIGNLKRLYAAEYSRTEGKNALMGRNSLARKLLNTAKETAPDSVGYYPMLSESIRLATTCYKAEVAFDAIAQLAVTHDINASTLQAEALQPLTLNEQNISDVQSASRLLMPAIQDAADADDLDQALQMAEAGEKIAKRIVDQSLSKTVADAKELLVLLKQQKSAYDVALSRLEVAPKDREANLTVAQFVGLRKGEWETAESYAARADEERLRVLFVQELASPQKVADSLRAANEWWDLSESLSGAEKIQARELATGRYKLIVANVSGFDKRVIESRLVTDGSKPAIGTRLLTPRFPNPNRKKIFGEKHDRPAEFTSTFDDTLNGTWMNKSGESREQSIKIVQKRDRLTITSSYHHPIDGEISWRFAGTVSVDGKIAGRLVHVKAPKSYRTQAVTANVSADARMIKGLAQIDGSLAKEFAWNREFPVDNFTGRQMKDFAGKSAGDVQELIPGIRFHWCPPGRFKMGEEKNTVEVTLTSGFWLSETEVTQQQWTTLMKTTPWKRQAYVKEHPQCPAVYVNHHDAVAYCDRLTIQEYENAHLPRSWEIRLPTEAQWEYACRAGANTKFSFGNEDQKLKAVGWYSDNADGKNEQYAHQVGTKEPNAWGLKDLHGNVWEWCADWYDERLSGGPDPAVLSNGMERIHRGGSWNNPPFFCRSAFRNKISPDHRSKDLGFRIATLEVAN